MGIFDWLNQAGKDIGNWFNGAGETIKNAANQAGGWINQKVIEPTKEFFNQHGEEIAKGLTKGAQIAGNVLYDIGKAVPGVGTVLTAAEPLRNLANQKIDEWTGMGPGARQQAQQAVVSAYNTGKALKPVLKQQAQNIQQKVAKRVRVA